MIPVQRGPETGEEKLLREVGIIQAEETEWRHSGERGLVHSGNYNIAVQHVGQMVRSRIRDVTKEGSWLFSGLQGRE